MDIHARRRSARDCHNRRQSQIRCAETEAVVSFGRQLRGGRIGVRGFRIISDENVLRTHGKGSGDAWDGLSEGRFMLRHCFRDSRGGSGVDVFLLSMSYDAMAVVINLPISAPPNHRRYRRESDDPANAHNLKSTSSPHHPNKFTQ